MGHEDKGNYAAKHQEKTIDPIVSEQIQKLAKEQSISCAAAHKAAALLEISPASIGIQIDLLEYRISNCQLGLFGYSDGKKRLDAKINVSTELSHKIDTKAVEGRLSCVDCWNIADEMTIQRLEMGSACEKKGIRIKPCQLGAF